MVGSRVKSLQTVLHDTIMGDLLEQGLSGRQKDKVKAVLQNGNSVVAGLKGKLDKYEVLADTDSDWNIKAR